MLNIRSDQRLQTMHQSRADHTTECVLRSFLTPALLVIDAFGLKRPQQSSGRYEIIIERHERSSTIIISKRAIDDWIPLSDDPLLAQSALDRLASNAYPITIEGESYLSRQRPGQYHRDLDNLSPDDVHQERATPGASSRENLSQADEK